jgi:hypothetical protein
MNLIPFAGSHEIGGSSGAGISKQINFLQIGCSFGAELAEFVLPISEIP